MLPQKTRLGVDERHRVLQLIAESERAARLVVSTARPNTTGQSLIQKPAVGQHIDGRVGCFHVHGAECVLPILPDGFEGATGRAGSPKALRQGAGVIGVPPRPECKYDFALLPHCQLKRNLNRSAGIHRGANPAGEPRLSHGGRTGQRPVASQEFSPVAADCTARLARIEEGYPIAKLRAVGVPREQRAAGGVDFSDGVHQRFRPQIPQHPLHVSGGGEPPGSTRHVSELERGELDRGVQGDVNPHLRADAGLGMFKHAVAEAMPRQIRSCSAARQRSRRPVVAALFVTEVKRFSAGIAHRIVAPGSEAELVGILAPGVGCAALRNDGSEVWISQNIHPRSRRHLSRPGGDDVLAPIRGESSQPVEEDQIAAGRLDRRQ